VHYINRMNGEETSRNVVLKEPKNLTVSQQNG